MLEVKGVSVSYGAIIAVREVSFTVGEGEIVALIGANGAGKSSLLRAISGMIPFTGSVIYRGYDLRNRASHEIVALGIAHVPEGRGIFGNLTVRENLLLATWQRRDKAAIASDMDHAFTLFPRLRERIRQLAGTLSGGEQQMLAIARALMSRGRMLLLDEPSMGLSPVLTEEIFRMLTEISREGCTILLVEQNAAMALDLASRGYVLETGRIVLEGEGKMLAENPLVRDAYLGARRMDGID